MFQVRQLFLLGIFFLIQLSDQLPVKEPKSTEKDPNKHEEGDSPTHNLENVIEYERYLKEVVGLLESDKEFRQKLDSASEADIRSGKIAQELELVDHNVRSKLDELKRTELERLRGLAREYYEKTNDIDREHLKIADHLDHENEHTFEIDDLKKLIVKTGEDLAEADRRRRLEFKEYEMQKEFEKEEKLRSMPEAERKKFEADYKRMSEKHNKHEKIHHPGSKDQLEEVWEKQDNMDAQDFDPKKFFMMHDVDGNGFWDEYEVKALFKIELDKVYQQGLPEDDMRERAEEMERMREHVYKEADVNRDRLISFQEFMDQTKKQEFQQDQGWDTVDQQPQYSHDEYLEFERRRQEEINRLIAEGRLQPHANMPGGYYPGDPNSHYQVPHPNEIPQNYQPNAQQQYHGQPPQQQYQAPPPNYQQPGNGQYQQPNAIPVHEAQNVQAHQDQMKQQYGEQMRQQAQVNQQIGQQQQQAPLHNSQQQQQAPLHNSQQPQQQAPPQNNNVQQPNPPVPPQNTPQVQATNHSPEKQQQPQQH